MSILYFIGVFLLGVMVGGIMQFVGEKRGAK